MIRIFGGQQSAGRIAHLLHPALAVATNGGGAFATYSKGTGSFASLETLTYTQAADREVQWLVNPHLYSGGNLSLKIKWYSDSTSVLSGNVMFGGCVSSIKPNISTQDIVTKAWGLESTILVSHLGSIGRRLHENALIIHNTDGLASDSYLMVRLRRLGSALTDNLAANIRVLQCTLEYSLISV